MNATLANSTLIGNSTIVESDTAASFSVRNSTLDFVIGLFIVLGASLLNAVGLNVTKLDHSRNAAIPRAERRADFLRPLWVLGLTSYILSQLVGSTLALQYLRAEFVAPLGSSSLIFNFIFAKILVKTPITRQDIYGTFIIILGVVGVVAFGNVRAKGTIDIEASLNLDVLKQLWTRLGWILYFCFLEVATLLIYFLASVYDDVWVEREELESPSEGRADADRYGGAAVRQEVRTFWQKLKERYRNARKFLQGRLRTWADAKPDATVKRVGGFLWAVAAGLLSSQTLIYAKSVVKLVSTGSSQFAHPLSIIIVLLLAATAVAQIICLNKGLRIADSTLVVPVLFACYSTFSFITSLVYLDQADTYSRTTGVFIGLSILVLCTGVVILSNKKSDPLPKTPRDLENEEEEAAAADGKGGIAMSILNQAKSKIGNMTLGSKDAQNRTKPTGTKLLSKGVDVDETAEAETEDDMKTPTIANYTLNTTETVFDAASPFDDKYRAGLPHSASRDSLDDDSFGNFVDSGRQK